jgi:hypothetical protein
MLVGAGTAHHGHEDAEEPDDVKRKHNTLEHRKLAEEDGIWEAISERGPKNVYADLLKKIVIITMAIVRIQPCLPSNGWTHQYMSDRDPLTYRISTIEVRYKRRY